MKMRMKIANMEAIQEGRRDRGAPREVTQQRRWSNMNQGTDGGNWEDEWLPGSDLENQHVEKLQDNYPYSKE